MTQFPSSCRNLRRCSTANGTSEQAFYDFNLAFLIWHSKDPSAEKYNMDYLWGQHARRKISFFFRNPIFTPSITFVLPFHHPPWVLSRTLRAISLSSLISASTRIPRFFRITRKFSGFRATELMVARRRRELVFVGANANATCCIPIVFVELDW